jgi:hypothetical protein
MKTLIFCTGYASTTDKWDNIHRNWLESVKASGLQYDQILIPDDASFNLPNWEAATILTGEPELTEQPVTELVIYKFNERLGRPALYDQPGWYRSFVYAGYYAKTFGFDKVIHIEADCCVISQRFVNYLNNFNDGWEAVWCPRHGLSDTSIQVIAGKQCIEAFSLFNQIDYNYFRGTPPDPREADQKGYLPFTTNKKFIGDRYGEYTITVPRNADYACQVFENIDRWWIREKIKNLGTMSRCEFLSDITLQNKKILEIGPFANPVFKRSQFNVQYADILSAEQLKLRAQEPEHGVNPADVPDKIDHIIDPMGDRFISTEEKFDIIFSSHNLEHQPNLIGHLCEMADLAADANCKYYLIIPDKRYCFDYYQKETSIAEILDAFITNRKIPSVLLGIEWNLYSDKTHNYTALHWQNNHGDDITKDITIDRIHEAIKFGMLCKDSYQDIHCSRFTPESFMHNISLLSAAKLIPWKIEQISDTSYNSNEFYVVLGLNEK